MISKKINRAILMMSVTALIVLCVTGVSVGGRLFEFSPMASDYGETMMAFGLIIFFILALGLVAIPMVLAGAFDL